MTVVAELVAKLGIDVDKASVNKADAVISGLGSTFADMAKAAGVAFGAAAAGLAVMVKQSVNAADEIGDTAERLGVTTDALQKLSYAANQSDVPLDTLAVGMKKLSVTFGQALQGNAQAIKDLKGIPLKDAAGNALSLTDAFAAVADKVQAAGGPMQQAAVAAQVFGERAGPGLVSLLRKGGAGILALTQEAAALGIVLDKTLIAQAGDIDSEWKKITAVITGFRTEVSGALFPVISKLSKHIIEWFKANREILKQRFVGYAQTLAKGMVAVAEAVMLVVDNLDKLKPILIVLTSLVLGFTIAVGLASTGMTLFSSVSIAAALASAAAWLVAAAPLALMTLAVAALIGFLILLGDEIKTFYEGGDSMLGRLNKWFNSFDPEDSPLIRLLKTAGALLFDFLDPGALERFQKAFIRLGESIAEAIGSALGGVFQRTIDNVMALIDRVPGLKQALSMAANPLAGLAGAVQGIGAAASAVSSGIQTAAPALAQPYSGGAASPAAAASYSPNVSRSTNTTVNATINVSGSDDPAAVARKVKEALASEISNANASVIR